MRLQASGFRLQVLLLCACGHPAPPHQSTQAPLSLAADNTMVSVPAEKYVAGSTPEERETAYDDYLATSGKDDAREGDWFKREEERHVTNLEAFKLDLMPVTNAQYALASSQVTSTSG